MSSIQYKTSLRPIVTVSNEVGSNDNMSKDVIAYEIQRSLGGKGTVTVTFADVFGFNDGSIQWKEVTSTPSYLALPVSTVPYTFVHIKNPGYRYSSATVLGSATDSIIKVLLSTNSTVLMIATLDPGCSIVLPTGTGIDHVTSQIGYKVVPSYIDGGAYLDTVTSTLSYGAYLDTVIGLWPSEDFILSTAMEILAVN